MIESAFVLCGGLGTRLRDAVADVPKVLAPIAGRPFLDLLVGVLHDSGVRRIVLLTGYLSELVEQHVAQNLRAQYPDVELVISPEPAPLGTGGAVQHAARFIEGPFLLLNGDTHLELDLTALVAAHHQAHALITIAVVHVPEAERFGTIDVGEDGRVRSFAEKGHRGPGLVNAGVYVVEPRALAAIAAGVFVSLERTTLPALVAAGEPVYAAVLPGSFVDIGTAESWSALSSTVAARTEV